jgi:hypothetical protein
MRDNLEALINRPVFYQLVEIAEHTKDKGRTRLSVYSSGKRFDIGEI